MKKLTFLNILLLLLIVGVSFAAATSNFIKEKNKVLEVDDKGNVVVYVKQTQQNIDDLNKRLNTLEEKQRIINQHQTEPCDALSREELLHYCYEAQPKLEDYSQEITELKSQITKIKKEPIHHLAI